MEIDLERNREYYVHDSNCSGNNFADANGRGLKTCLECAGIFDAETGAGVCVTDKRFDENWVPPTAPE